METVREVNRRGITVVMIEHVMRATMAICQRILVLHHGRRIALDTPEEVCRDEQGPPMLPGRAVCADGGRKKGDNGLNAAPANNWLLNVNDLDAGYGNAQVLWKVSLQVAESEIVGLLGGNGAGKTTLINTISGLVSQKAGTIHYAGKDITHTDHYARVRSGITQIPEGRQLFPGLTVRQKHPARRLFPARQVTHPGRPQFHLRSLSDSVPERETTGRDPLRGRAADVRDRQGAHVEPEAYTGR